MTITNALSPARETAFHSTLSAQQKRNGQVQFSLPPAHDPTAPAGSSTPAIGAAALSRNTLPIAVPVAALNGLGTVTSPSAASSPASATPPPVAPVNFGNPGVTLPIATPIAALNGLGSVTSPATAAPPANFGNPGIALPIATPVLGVSGLTLAASAQPAGAASPVAGSGIGTVSNHGNLVSAQLISRLYQRHG